MKKTIIVDIDNTIVDQVPRKKKILENLGISINEEILREDFDLHSVLRGTNRAAFMKSLLGPELQDCLLAIPGSVEGCNTLKSDYHILYFSSRPENQKQTTVQHLKKLGFPIPNGNEVEIALWPAECDIGELTEDEIKRKSLDWKCRFISEYVSRKSILVGISDTPEDISIFAKLGIPSILFHSHGKQETLRKEIETTIKNKFISQSVEFTSDWQQILYTIITLDRVEDELTTLVQTHTAEYTSFLADLDAKARLLLIIATFLGTSFFGMSWQAFSNLISSQCPTSKILGWLVGIIAIMGLMVSLLAMVFSIKAFGSRHTRGIHIGKMISIEQWRRRFWNFFLILFGREICPPSSPIEEAKLAREEKGLPMRRLTHLAFFQRNYGTFDAVLIRNQRMLDMRALNYEKIYPEICARQMLFMALILVFICFLITMVGLIWKA